MATADDPGERVSRVAVKASGSDEDFVDAVVTAVPVRRAYLAFLREWYSHAPYVPTTGATRVWFARAVFMMTTQHGWLPSQCLVLEEFGGSPEEATRLGRDPDRVVGQLWTSFMVLIHALWRAWDAAAKKQPGGSSEESAGRIVRRWFGVDPT
jgi:hypothetical protein